jgi:hypothetical protein
MKVKCVMWNKQINGLSKVNASCNEIPRFLVKVECVMSNKQIDGLSEVNASSNGIPRFFICVLRYGDHGKKFMKTHVGNWVLPLLESWAEC